MTSQPRYRISVYTVDPELPVRPYQVATAHTLAWAQHIAAAYDDYDGVEIEDTFAPVDLLGRRVGPFAIASNDMPF